MGTMKSPASGSHVSARLKWFLRAELTRAERQLGTWTGDDDGTRVHEARKSIKKLRAGLRLAVKMLPKAKLRSMDVPLRSAAHWLGPLRDEEVLKQTVSSLKKGKEPVPTKAEPSPQRVPVLKARAALKRADRALRGMDWDSLDGAAWKAGLKRLYRRSRKAMQTAAASGGDDDLHRWRRRAKDFFYALGLLDGKEIPGGPAMLRKVKRLTEYLGDDHDLAFLEQSFSAEEQRAKFEALFRRAETKRRGLQAKALTLGQRTLREKAGEFRKRLGG